ncbi:GNAT family N-acetyltransferase [Fructilactobacillus frigidiflavus]|uniref:GNAT family N-acetyltransferase n=1 Tax=Fructilactobacillus frigidiflavus TaxID=3242688 RepID=UPI003758277A
MASEIKKITNTPENVEKLHQMMVDTFWDTYRGSSADHNIADYLKDNYSPQQIAAQLEQSNCAFYFIMKDGVAAGYMKLNFDDAQTETYDGESVEIEKLYVLNAFKRQGLGRQLLEFAEQIANQQHAEYLWLGVWSDNDKALAFYHEIGFRQTTTHTFNLGDDPQTDLVMVKKL